MKSFSAKLVVPDTPTGGIDQGQTVFLFLSLMNEDMTGIIQPVLQFGNPDAPRFFGGPEWLLRNWFIPSGGKAAPTQLRPLSAAPGQEIKMSIVVDPISDDGYHCVASFDGLPQLDLAAVFYTEPTWASITMETYSMFSRADYPNSDPIVFTDIVLEDQAGNTIMPIWTTKIQPNVAGCTAGTLCPMQCAFPPPSSVLFKLC